MLMRAATVVQVLQDLFYVLLHVLFYLWSLLYYCPSHPAAVAAAAAAAAAAIAATSALFRGGSVHIAASALSLSYNIVILQ